MRLGQRSNDSVGSQRARQDSFLAHAVPWCTPYHPHPNSIMPCWVPVRVSLQFGIGSRMYNASQLPVRIQLRMQIDELASCKTWEVSYPRLREYCVAGLDCSGTSGCPVLSRLSSLSPRPPVSGARLFGGLCHSGAVLRIAVLCILDAQRALIPGARAEETLGHRGDHCGSGMEGTSRKLSRPGA